MGQEFICKISLDKALAQHLLTITMTSKVLKGTDHQQDLNFYYYFVCSKKNLHHVLFLFFFNTKC